MQRLGNSFSSQIEALKKTMINGQSALGGTFTADMGLGSGSFVLGQSDFSNAYSGLTAAIGSIATGNVSVDPSTLDGTISQINAAIAAEGAKASLIHNRYDALNDLASSYVEASNNQVVADGGSATSLLNSLL